MWAFKQLYDKGLVYEGFRVLPYCWNDETPLSNHELRMDDDVYQNRQDPAVTVGFRLRAPARLAADLDDDPVDAAVQPRVMVGPDIDYVVVESRRSPASPSATCSPRRGWRRTPRADGRGAPEPRSSSG